MATHMHLMYTLLLFVSVRAHALDEIVPVETVKSAGVCQTSLKLTEDRPKSLERGAQFIARQLTGYGELAQRSALVAEYSLANKLAVPTPIEWQTPFGTDTIPAAEYQYTEAQRVDLARRLSDLSALPREWRLRGARAFLIAVGDKESDAHPGLSPALTARVHEIMEQVRDRVIGDSVPDATESEIRRLKSLKTGFVVRTLPPG